MLSKCREETLYNLAHSCRVRGYYVQELSGVLICERGGIKFSLSLLPGNRRTLISHHVSVNESLRGKGLGRKGLQERQAIALEAGITLILATVRDDNVIEQHLLITEGWQRLTQNQRTHVSLWGKEIKQDSNAL